MQQQWHVSFRKLFRNGIAPSPLHGHVSISPEAEYTRDYNRIQQQRFLPALDTVLYDLEHLVQSISEVSCPEINASTLRVSKNCKLKAHETWEELPEHPEKGSRVGV